ncbi:MAG: four helix bundle protein [Planctomycetes bacterium]|nr:four helix bundle protein [Planctomycetota bacterium]
MNDKEGDRGDRIRRDVEPSMNPGLADLVVYRIAEEASDRVWVEVERWPIDARISMGTQVVKSADSIGANIAEAYGRWHFRDRLNFLFFSRGSMLETDSRWRKAFRRKLIDEGTFKTVADLLKDLSPRLNNFIRSVRRNSGIDPDPAGGTTIADVGSEYGSEFDNDFPLPGMNSDRESIRPPTDEPEMDRDP